MTNKTPTVALTGGGSGGHITPLLSLAHELKNQRFDCQIIYIGHKGDNFDSLRLPKQDFDSLAFINAGKFRRYHGESFLSHLLDIQTIFFNARDFFRVIKSFGSAYRLLKKFKVDVVFAKGGFVSVPVGLAAKIRGIPIVTHDSDTLGGLANRIVGRWAVVKATGMPTSFYPQGKVKLEYVGIPLDKKIVPTNHVLQASYKKELGFEANEKILLAAGGGLGSQHLNKLIISSSARLLQSIPELRIVHVTGQQHLASSIADYGVQLDKTQISRVECMGFTPEFYRYSGAADLILSRAGATAIAEFALQGKPCLIMPSPFLTGGHQLKNAEELARHDAAVILDEQVEVDELTGVIIHLLGDTKRLDELGAHIAQLAKPGAAKKLARIILAQADNEN